MRIPPPEVWASFPPYDPAHPETHGRALVIVNVVFIVIMLLCAFMRFYARIVTKHWFGWDDALLGLALFFAINMNIAVMLANQKYGWNRHIWAIPFGIIQNANIVAFVAKILFTLAATFTRLSLIAFFYRLVKDSGIVWYRWILHISAAWNIALCITFVFEVIFLCTPVQFYWQFPPRTAGHCLNEGTVTLVAGIQNCVSDLWTTLLPLPLVLRLQMPLKQRIGVCALLSLGIVVTVAGIVRTYFIWKGFIDTWDQTWYSYPLWISAAIEIDIAVICACVPSIRTLLRAPFQKARTLFSTKLSSKTSSRLSGTRRSPHSTNSMIRLPSATSSHPHDVAMDQEDWYRVTKLGFERENDPNIELRNIDYDTDYRKAAENAYAADSIISTTCHGPITTRTQDHYRDPESQGPRSPPSSWKVGQITKEHTVEVKSSS